MYLSSHSLDVHYGTIQPPDLPLTSLSLSLHIINAFALALAGGDETFLSIRQRFQRSWAVDGRDDLQRSYLRCFPIRSQRSRPIGKRCGSVGSAT